MRVSHSNHRTNVYSQAGQGSRNEWNSIVITEQMYIARLGKDPGMSEAP